MESALIQKICSTLSKGKELSFDEIMLFMKQVQNDGNAFLIKLDGVRSINEEQYTVVVGFPHNPEKDVIRSDTRVLKEACLGVIRQYLTESGEVVKHARSTAKRVRTILAKSQDPSLDEILLRAEKIKQEGNVFIISSGNKGYSVSILYPLSAGRENIEVASDILMEACLSAIRQHLAR